MEHSFTLFQYMPGLNHLPVHVAGAILVSGILVALTFVARLRLAASGNALVPSDKVTFLNIFEIIAEQLYNLTKKFIGEDGAKEYFPLVGTIFIYILLSNYIGLIPGMLPPTDNMNTNLAVGLFVFVYYNYVGVKAAGLAYFKHFLGPVWYIAWLLLPIELVSHIVRPLSLSLRLYGNMQGDHMVLAVMTDLTQYIIPVAFYGLGILVCTIQAFVFTLLTMVYIAMARETAHH